MPKRTNPFQKLIATIYSQMAEKDDQVTESTLLRERGSATEREIDILLRKCVFQYLRQNE